MGEVKCQIDSDCPILENKPDGNWNCENFCGEGRCQFKCVQKHNVSEPPKPLLGDFFDFYFLPLLYAMSILPLALAALIWVKGKKK